MIKKPFNSLATTHIWQNDYFFRYFFTDNGEEKRNYSIAKGMKSKNMDINLISEITGLTIYKIKNSKILNSQKTKRTKKPLRTKALHDLRN